MAGIRKKFSFQLLYALSQILFPLITYPYITRTIGAEGLGLVGYVDYVSGFIITITALGIPFYGVREVAKRQASHEQRQQLFRQLLTIHFFTSLLGVLIFIGIIKANPNQAIPTSLLVLGCINILLPPFVAEWYMQGMEAFQFTTIRSIVLRLLGLVAILLFISSPQDFTTYFLIIVLVQGAVAATNLSKIGFANVSFTTAQLKEHLRPLWHFFLTASLISVYVFFDVIILGWFADEKAVGFYAVAVRLVKLSLLLVLSLNVILFPRISNLLTTGDQENIRNLLMKAMQFIILLTFPLTAGFYFLAPQIISLLAGDEFQPSVPLVQILSPLPLVIGLSNLFVYQVLVPFAREKKLLFSVLVTCILSLILHSVLVYSFAERGTATATLLTEICMTILTAFFAYRSFAFEFPAKALWQSVVALLPLILLILFCQRELTNHIAILFCSALPGMFLYGSIQLFLFKNELLKEVFSNLRWRRKFSVTNG